MPNNDLIDRRPLIVYFEGLARSLANARCFTAADAIQGAADKLRKAPAIDAIEVVRCNECIYFGNSMNCAMCNDEMTWTDDSGAVYYTVDRADYFGFCHLGKRDESNAEQ